jgi:DNA-binding MarR family transcriptional regulator
MATTPRTHGSLALLAYLARVGMRDADAMRAEDGLGSRHLVALTLLRDHGSASQQGLAETLRLDPSNVVGLLNELERGGFVTRRRDEADRRRHIVEMSEAGNAALVAAERRLEDVEERVLGTLSAEERATLHALLLRAAGDQLPTCSEVAADADC